MMKNRGFVDVVALAMIVGCFAVGGYYMFRSKEIDAPAEQAAEAVLATHGINVDFSADKKHELQNSKTQVQR